jgi:hypothetical protein
MAEHILIRGETAYKNKAQNGSKYRRIHICHCALLEKVSYVYCLGNCNVTSLPN